MPVRQRQDAGAYLYFRGEKADKVYALVSGNAVEEYVEGEVRLEVKAGPGACLGVLEAIGGGTRLAEARCVTAAEFEIWTAAEFLARYGEDPALLETTLQRGIALLNELNDQAKALMAGHGGPEAFPEAAFFAMGGHYEKSGRPALAEYIYRRYGELFPTGPHAAEAKAKSGTLDTAIDAAVLDSLPPEGLLSHAAMLEDKGDYPGAIDIYKRLVMMDLPDQLLPTAQVRAANAYVKVEKPLLALKVLKRYPMGQGKPEEDQQAFFLFGCVYQALGELPQAERAYEQCHDGMWGELAKVKLAELKPNG